MSYTIEVNNQKRTVDVDGDMPLLWVLRDVLDLKGTKFGCGIGMCGACTVHLGGRPVRSCLTPVSSVGNAAVTTIEGIGDTLVGKRVQEAWLAVDVPQCGYCQAGQIMSATALLVKKPQPTDADIDGKWPGNVCRCCTYNRIRAAIKQAAGPPTTDYGGSADDVCQTHSFPRRRRPARGHLRRAFREGRSLVGGGLLALHARAVPTGRRALPSLPSLTRRKRPFSTPM